MARGTGRRGPVNHFGLLDGELACEAVPLRRLADEVGTPLYVYSSATLRRHYAVFRDAVTAHPRAFGQPLIAYAVKANGNLSVLKTLAAEGCGADTVSGGEIRRALAAGIPGERIVFSGVGKTAAEMERALAAGIHCFNVESAPELARLSERARLHGRVAPVAIRVNPDIDAGTHPYISPGLRENKFWPAVRRIDSAYGDRNLMCSCIPVESYDQEEALAV